MELQGSTYAWLIKAGITLPPNDDAETATIQESDAIQFSTGVHIATLLRSEFGASIGVMKTDAIAASRLANWNALLPILAKIGIKITQQTKTLIIAGDLAKTVEVVEQIRAAFLRTRDKARNDSRKQINLETLNTTVALDDTVTTLEFVVVSLCQNLEISAKQAVGLLTQDNKYLGQAFARGLRGSFTPLLEWTQSLYTHTDHLVSLIEADPSTLAQVLQIMGVAFASKTLDLAQWVLKLVTRFVLTSQRPEILRQINAWICGDMVYSVVVLAFRFKFGMLPDILDFLISVTDGIALRDVVCEKMLRCVDRLSDYFALCHDLLRTAVVNETHIATLESSGVLLSWIEITSEAVLSDAQGARISGLTFLTDIWLTLTTSFDENDSLTSTFLELLTKECKQSSRVVQANAFVLSFKIVDRLTAVKNGFAPVFYKTLIFLFVEHFHDSDLRESVSAQFIQLLSEHENIPSNFLVEPLVKRMGVSPEYDLIPSDFYLLQRLGEYASLSRKSCVLILDLMAKMFWSAELYWECAKDLFAKLLARFVEEDPIQKFVCQFVRVSNKQIFATESEPDKAERTKTIMNSLFTMLVDLKSTTLNAGVADELVRVITQRVNSKQVRAYFVSKLKLFGDPNQLLPRQASQSVDVSHVNQSYEQSPEAFGKWKLRAIQEIQKAKTNRQQIEVLKQEQRQSRMEKVESLRLKRQRRGKPGAARALNRSADYSMARSSRQVSLPSLIHLKKWDLPREEEEYSLVQILLAKYKRAFRQLFDQYKATGNERKPNNVSDFEWIAQRKKRLTKAELVKLCSDMQFAPTLLTRDQLGQVINLFCQANSTDRQSCEVRWIPEFFAQLSFFIYRGEHPVICLTNLVNYMRNRTLDKGASVEAYDEPDYGNGDKNLCRKLSEQIESDPYLALPDGYERVDYQDIEIEDAYEFSDESFEIAYKILDDLLFKTLRMRYLENIYHVVSKVYVKGVRTEIVPDTVLLGPTLKYEVAQYDIRDQGFVTEVAVVLEDLIKSVEKKANRVMTRNPRMTQVVNRAVMTRLLQQQEQEELEAEKEIKRRRRNEKLNRQLDEYIEQKQQEMIREQVQHDAEQEIERKRAEERETKLARLKQEKEEKLREWKAQKQSSQQTEPRAKQRQSTFVSRAERKSLFDVKN